ncbi:MAG: peptidylprolyl isomerase [Acidobacteria bacterium]|nr:peptidylprolyl isomerase [Acidobacteriota bacterium]
MPRRKNLIVAVLVCLAAGCSDQPKPQPAASRAEPELPAQATAIIETDAGRLTCELFPQEAPRNVANFIGLAEGTHEWEHPLNHRRIRMKLYDGTSFHRVIPGFMIQGGDPAGNGSGGPGYRVPDEIRTSLKFDRPGRMAMANDGANTNGSQFFVTERATPHLDGRYTIIGQCDNPSVQVVKKIARMPRDTNDDRPFNPVKIRSVTIQRENSSKP